MKKIARRIAGLAAVAIISASSASAVPVFDPALACDALGVAPDLREAYYPGQDFSGDSGNPTLLDSSVHSVCGMVLTSQQDYLDAFEITGLMTGATYNYEIHRWSQSMVSVDTQTGQIPSLAGTTIYRAFSSSSEDLFYSFAVQKVSTIPLPATGLMLMGALGGLAALRRRAKV